MANLDVEKCRELLNPKNIFDLLNRDVFEELMRGFHYKFPIGAVLYWAEREEPEGKWLMDPEKRIEPVQPDGDSQAATGEDRAVCPNLSCQVSAACPRWPPQACPFCIALHKTALRDLCFECDHIAAQAALDEGWSEAVQYRCWGGLIDLGYPLRFDSEVRAFLIAGGQMAPKDPQRRAKIKERLKALYGNETPALGIVVEGKSIPLDPGVVENVREKIQKLYLTRELWEKKIDEIPDPPEGEEDKDQRLQALDKSGKALQEIIDSLYEGRMHNATRTILQQSLSALARADLSSRSAWWTGVSGLFSDFCELTGLENIAIYTRRQSRFERLDPRDGKDGKNRLIPTSSVFQTLEKGELTRLDPQSNPSAAGLLDALGLSGQTVHAFRTEHLADRFALSTLMAITGKVSRKTKEQLSEFCEVVCGRADVVSMVFRLQDAQEDYRMRVGSVAHSFRAPLQNVLLDLDELSKTCGVVPGSALAKRIQRSKDRVFDAGSDIQILLNEASERIEGCDLRELVSKVMQTLDPEARRKGCTLVLMESPAPNLPVRVNKDRLRRAFLNLFQNAVKYSWDNHEIRVWLERQAGDMAMVRITNYGIGIPPDAIESIRWIGGRAEVPDRKRPVRTGSGWGVPVADAALRAHEGWLDMASYRADNGFRKPGEEYHRYITDVCAYLPLVSEE